MRLIIFIITILINIKVYSQFTTMFNDTLKPFGAGAYSFENIIESDSDYFISGEYSSAQGQFPFVVKLTEAGTVINKKLYTDSIYGFAIFPYNSMIQKKNSLIICGQIWGGGVTTSGFVASINKLTLDTLWLKIIVHPDTAIANQPNSGQFSELTAIKPTPDGGYILTGNYNKNCITGNLRSFLMKIDSVGNVEWRRVYNNITGYLYDIEITPNGGYILINKYFGTIVINTDSIGNILWQKKVNNLTIEATISDMSYAGNNNYVGIVSYVYDNVNLLTALDIFKINLTNKQVLWEKQYKLFKGIESVSLHKAMGVEVLPNGSIIVSGTANRYGLDAVILKLNSNGDSLWCKSYDYHPDPYDCQLNDLIITDDGGFMGVGFFSDQSGPGWTAWMFKTDANGVVGWESPKPQSRDKHFKIYPNPARDYTTLKYNCRYENLNYTISDIQGKVFVNNTLKTISDITSNEVLINLGNLSSGNYQIIIKSNNIILWTEKLIITE